MPLSQEAARVLRIFVARMTGKFQTMVRGELKSRRVKIDAILASAHRERLENMYAKNKR